MRAVSGGRVGRLEGLGRVCWRVPVSHVPKVIFALVNGVADVGALV